MITKNRKKLIPFTFSYTSIILLFIIFLVCIQYISKKDAFLAGKMYPNVYIDNQLVGEKSKSDLVSQYRKKYKGLQDINLVALYNNQPIATFSAQMLNIHSNVEEILERAYLIGRASHAPSRLQQKLASILNLQKYQFHSRISYDEVPIQEFISTIEEQYNKSAKNALFKFENGKVVQFRTEEKGLKIDSKMLLADAAHEIQGIKPGTRNIILRLTEIILEPEITLAKANQYGIEELIGEGKSDFTHSMSERIHNIIVGTSKFDGVLIPKDSTFSFNQTIGDISSLTGYKPAYIIKEGKTVLGDGGGVCQISTTFFRAALNTGLPIIERTAHAYRVIYYENDAKPGLDATVFAPTVDLKIQNNTPSYILIQTEIDKDNNLLYFRFYGKKDNRKVELSQISVYDVQPPPSPRYQDDPTLKRGVIKQVDFPAWGGKSKYSYKVIQADTILFEKEFFSVYRPWQAVFLVGIMD